MRNISKKTRKKINKILLSDHFKKKLGVTQDTLVYTPNPESPLSACISRLAPVSNSVRSPENGRR